MSKKLRRNRTPVFKSKVAFVAIKTTAELAQHFDIHANQTALWKPLLLEQACLLPSRQFSARFQNCLNWGYLKIQLVEIFLGKKL